MSAINFPLTTDISNAANQVSSQNTENLPAGGSGHSTGLRPDTVTLSAVFPPLPPVDAANFVQFRSPAQPALESFPPAASPAASASAQLASAADAAATSAAGTPSLSQQEQLAQLNRVLEQLGINPQSISLDNRLALIKSANDPPALLNLVRTLGGLNPAASEQISALSANNLSNPAPTGNQTPAPAQNESQAQPPPASIPPLQSSSSPAGSGFESTSSGAGGAAPLSPSQASVASNAASHFQELQALFQEADNAQNPSSAAGSKAVPQPSLSIRV
jgi:hypothetical protein